MTKSREKRKLDRKEMPRKMITARLMGRSELVRTERFYEQTLESKIGRPGLGATQMSL
jgi:hypothetical protein